MEKLETAALSEEDKVALQQNISNVGQRRVTLEKVATELEERAGQLYVTDDPAAAEVKRLAKKFRGEAKAVADEQHALLRKLHPNWK